MIQTGLEAITRRHFLAKAGLGLAMVGTTGALNATASAQQQAATEKPQQSPTPPMPPDKRLGYAIVGLGKLALEQILPAFGESKRARPVALVSGHRDKAERVAQQYGIAANNIYDYQTYDRLRDNPDVDIIYIVLPNGLHAEYVVRGAQAGKHILCEKPMANSVNECQQMIEACEKAKRRLMIAYRQQYEPYNRAAIALARKQEFGPLKAIFADNGQNMGDPDQWRLKKSLSGGGALPDVGIYCLNATRYLTGEEPIEIRATTYSTPGDPRFREVEEYVAFTLRYPSGVQAVCTTSYGYHNSKRYRVNAADGWFELDPAFEYRGLRMRVAHKSGQQEAVEERRMGEKNQFALEMDHMAQCVAESRKPHTPGEEGLQDMRLIAAIYEAAQSGQAVKLPAVSGKDVYRGTAPSES